MLQLVAGDPGQNLARCESCFSARGFVTAALEDVRLAPRARRDDVFEVRMKGDGHAGGKRPRSRRPNDDRGLAAGKLGIEIGRIRN